MLEQSQKLGQLKLKNLRRLNDENGKRIEKYLFHLDEHEHSRKF
jgi:hypothetical protein